MVGAVLVHEHRIIGEGFHAQYGGPHAEVNCFQSVQPADRLLIPDATLYCSLEPCSHYGKTPPCADLVIKNQVKKLVISNLDPNPLVAGQGVAKIRAAGIEVETGLLEPEGAWLNRVFFKWIQQKTPYIILKWAQSQDGYIGTSGARTAISNPITQRLNHRWRSEIAAILVGNTTAVVDNPSLNTRTYPGPNPLRIALDRKVNIPGDYHLFDDSQETWIYGPQRTGAWQKLQFMDRYDPFEIPELLEQLSKAQKSSLLVEGGANLLNQFIAQNFWDEIRVIENAQMLGSGLPAPDLPAQLELKNQFHLQDDQISVYVRRVAK
jgi:diaminohydroxyphosphoribosylaminopyrimidine deaminase/5-amino-6-(5-phosphoribosylamino)uracil reductase